MLDNKRIKIRNVYYVTPRQMWRFYGYYGGLNVVGDYHTYGQYADDSTFQVIPAWQNKMQAISYEDHLYTRTSHYSYEVIDNKLRLYPIPDSVSPEKFWFRFTVDNTDIWEDSNNGGQHGVNNMNTLPFENFLMKTSTQLDTNGLEGLLSLFQKKLSDRYVASLVETFQFLEKMYP